MKIYLEHHLGKKRKFWQIEVDGVTRTVTQGNIGAKKAPVPKEKAFKTAEAAEKDFEKEVGKKIAAGYFDPTSLSSVLAGQAEFLNAPDDAEVEAHRRQVPHCSENYLRVFRTGALVGNFNDQFGKPAGDPPGMFSGLAALVPAFSAEDVVDDAALDPFIYLIGDLYDGTHLFVVNQGRWKDRVGLSESGLDEMVFELDEDDVDGTLEMWIEEGWIELFDSTLEEFVLEGMLHYKGALMERIQAVEDATRTLEARLGDDPESIETLDLSEQGLRTLPSLLTACKNLRSLNLADNNLAVLPPVVRELEKLEHLVLDSNRMGFEEDLPEWIAELPLKTLSYRYCMYDDFPLAVTGCTGLKELRLSGVEQIPAEIGNLTELEVLDIGGVAGTVNRAVSRCTKLRELRLGRTSAVVVDIASLTELEVLEADHQNRNIELTWPNGLGTLSKLRVLKVGCAKLPQTIGGLVCLEELITSAEELPSALSDLKSLRRLDLQYSRATALPESFGQLGQLQWLQLESSYIDRLPPSFSDLANLEWLSIATANGLEIGGSLKGLNLQHLEMHYPSVKTIKGDLSLANLEVLKIFREPDPDDDWRAQLAFLSTLPSLKKLGINWNLRDELQEMLPDVEMS